MRGAVQSGTPVVLTAKPNSGNTFAEWFGACTGASTTCTVAATGHVDVGAAFTTLPTGGDGGGGGTSGGDGSGGSGKTP